MTTDKKIGKKIERLPGLVRLQLSVLIKEIESLGPVRGNWPNYGALDGDRHHCHLKKGHSTYVAVWEIVNKEIRIVEITYAGTHERAPY